MNDNLTPFLLTAGCALCQYFALLLTGHNKPSIWKRGIYGGMGGSGWAASGFVAERLDPLPWHTFAVSTLFMLSCVVVSYYQASLPDENATPEQIALSDSRHHRALSRIAISIIATLCVAVIVAFMDGKKKGEQLQAVSVEAIQDIARAFTALQKEVQRSSGRLDARDKADSLFRLRSIKNQERGLQNQAEVKEALRGQTAGKPVRRTPPERVSRPEPVYPGLLERKSSITPNLPIDRVKPVLPAATPARPSPANYKHQHAMRDSVRVDSAEVARIR